MLFRSKLCATMMLATAALAPMAFADTAMENSYLTWPAYDGDDRELKVDNSGTHFTLWAPKAEAVKVNIYDTDRNTPAVASYQMKKSDNGTWRVTVPEPSGRRWDA